MMQWLCVLAIIPLCHVWVVSVMAASDPVRTCRLAHG